MYTRLEGPSLDTCTFVSLCISCAIGFLPRNNIIPSNLRKNAVQQKSIFSPELQLMLGRHANDAHALRIIGRKLLIEAFNVQVSLLLCFHFCPQPSNCLQGPRKLQKIMTIKMLKILKFVSVFLY